MDDDDLLINLYIPISLFSDIFFFFMIVNFIDPKSIIYNKNTLCLLDQELFIRKHC